MKKPVNQNVGDKAQVAEAQKRENSLRAEQVQDMQAILGLPQGRRFLWRLLEECSTFHSIWEPSAKIHYNSGKQDVGHFVQDEIILANPEAYIEMMKAKQKGEL